MTERTRYRFVKVCRAMPLLTELQAAGIPVGLVNPGNGYTEVDLYPEDFDRAATVVQAHDAAALDAAEALRATALRDAKATLRTYYQQSPATITNAQSVAAIKALIVAVRALAQIDN